MRIPKCLSPASRIAPSARREYFSTSAFETKSDGIAPSCSRKPAAIDLNHAPSCAQSASYAPSSRIGETARSAKSAEAAACEKRSSVMDRHYKLILYRRTVTLNCGGMNIGSAKAQAAREPAINSMFAGTTHG